MPTVVLAALVVFVVVTAVSLAVAVRQGLAAWRALKRLRRDATESMNELTRKLAELEAHTARLPRRLARLEDARASLEASLAETRVLLRGASEIAALIHGVRGVIPTR
jgi:septal ring factor EnvC (AmiA/AmiB activator)